MAWIVPRERHGSPLMGTLNTTDGRERCVYAVVRKNTYDRTKLAQGRQLLTEFDEIHARQPGFRGTISIDCGDDSVVVMNLWESEEHARAGLEVLRPVVQRLLVPLLKTESVLIGEGQVVADSLATH